MDTFKIRDGYDRRKHAPLIKVRRMSLDEVKALQPGDHVEFESATGVLRVARVSGQVKRWVREPDRIEVPIKYGLYESCRLDNSNYQMLVVRVGKDEEETLHVDNL
jgi:translation initiation factor IF-1